MTFVLQKVLYVFPYLINNCIKPKEVFIILVDNYDYNLLK